MTQTRRLCYCVPIIAVVSVFFERALKTRENTLVVKAIGLLLLLVMFISFFVLAASIVGIFLRLTGSQEQTKPHFRNFIFSLLIFISCVVVSLQMGLMVDRDEYLKQQNTLKSDL